MIITLSGLPGSGKTTAAKLVSERLGLQWYSMGDMRGKMARDRGLTIDELNELGLQSDATDREVDEYQRQLGEREDNFVVDGWISWHFIPHSFKIFMKVDPDVAATRIFQEHRHAVQNDEPAYASPENAKAVLAHRVENSRQRYLKYYGADYLDMSHYDLVIDTTAHTTPEETFAKIQKALEGRG